MSAVGPSEIAFVRDATAKNYRYFFDGVEDPAGPGGYPSNPSDFGSCVIKIGSNDGADSFANTAMDELAIWHIMLDANQLATVAWLYRKGIPLQAWVDGQIPMQNGNGAGDPSPAFDVKHHVALMAQLENRGGLNGPFTSQGKVSVSRSTNGGVNWSSPVRVFHGHGASIGGR